MDRRKVDLCTLVVNDETNGAPILPIYQNSLFFRTQSNVKEYNYTRHSNPTTDFTERILAELENGEKAVCFSSGMAAISSAILSCVQAGSSIVAFENIYGGTKGFINNYMAKFGIKVKYVSGRDIGEIEDAIDARTALIYFESPSYLYFEIADIRKIAALARGKGIMTIFDNTVSTPLFQNPLDLGIDIVVHSMSKYINGHSDIVGGVAVGSEKLMTGLVNSERMLLGAVMDPHQAWLVTRGIRTLPSRMEKHAQNAMGLALSLQSNDRVKNVYYPGLQSHPGYELALTQMTGFSGLLSFSLDFSQEQVQSFVKNLKVIHPAPSWGGFESLIVCFGTDVLEQRCKGKNNDQIFRISAGLEHVDTIIEDVQQAIKNV